MTRRRLVAVIALSIPVLLSVAGALYHFHLRRALETYKEDLAAKGAPRTVRGVARTPTQEASSAARELLAVSSRLRGLGTISPGIMRGVSPGHAQIAWQQDSLVDESGTNLWPALVELIRQQEGELRLACEIVEGGSFQFALDYSQGFNMLLPHAPRLKALGQMLSAAAVVDMRDGHVDRACRYLAAGAMLSSNYEIEPLMISHLVRFAIHSIVWGATWEALAHPSLTETQMAELQTHWEQLDFLEDIPGVLTVERVFGGMAFEQMRQSHAVWTAYVSNPFGGAAATTVSFDEIIEQPVQSARTVAFRYLGYWSWRWWYSYSDELRYARAWQSGVEAHALTRNSPSYEAAQQALKRLLASGDADGEDLIFGNPKDLVERFLSKAATAQTQRNMMIAGLALHRYRVRMGRWPNELGELVPEYLKEVPRDVMDGSPLRYRAEKSGEFVLYSVGKDFRDHGGDANTSTENKTPWFGRDWVWPKPATPDQISAYWKKRSKRR